MKKYVIMSSSISNMGGAQMYHRNKILYLREHGWVATIIAGQAVNVVIPELKEFNATIPELGFSSYLYTLKRQRQVINRLKNLIVDDKYEEIYIESASIGISTWAELIAKDIGAKHLIFLLQEQNSLINKSLQDFFIFKYNRHELVSINKKSLFAMFRDFYPIEETKSYYLSANCNNVEADVDCELIGQIDRTQYDYIVGAFSRLNKPFVFYAVEDFCNYASSHPENRFFFLWIGDAPSGSDEPKRVKRMIGALPNVQLLITGYMLPVPTKLLELCDVFISSAGSCWPCVRSGVPTISYDGNDFKPIGILGRSTKNSVFRDKDEKPQDLSLLLDAILVKKEYPRQQAEYRSGIPNFKKHIEFLEDMDHRSAYYDIQNVQLESSGDKKVAFGLRLLGPKGYFWMHGLKNHFG